MNYSKRPSIAEMAGIVLVFSLIAGVVGLASGAASFWVAFLLVAVLASAVFWVLTRWDKQW